MKLPQYSLLKVSSSRKGTSIEAEWVDFVTCGECKKRKKNDFCLEHMRYEKNDEGYCSYGEREGE